MANRQSAMAISSLSNNNNSSSSNSNTIVEVTIEATSANHNADAGGVFKILAEAMQHESTVLPSKPATAETTYNEDCEEYPEQAYYEENPEEDEWEPYPGSA